MRSDHHRARLVALACTAALAWPVTTAAGAVAATPTGTGSPAPAVSPAPSASSGTAGAPSGPGASRGTGTAPSRTAGTSAGTRTPSGALTTGGAGSGAGRWTGAVVRVRQLSGRYVVEYKRTATPRAAVSSLAARATHRYRSAVRGFAAQLTPAQLAAVRADPAVASVVPDVLVHADATQLNPPWGLDRIDQPSLPLDNSFTPTGDGTGVTAYVLDTGLRATHQEFTGRVGTGINFAPHTSDANPSTTVDPADTSDCDGHGTHVAGTIGGSTTGVARNVTIIPVRVLDCEGSGTLSDVIAGVDWVTAQHSGPSVANMSLGAPAGDSTATLDTAIAASIAAGVTYAVAAGNESDDACTDSPADVAAAITVGATTSRDAAADYSNYGSCVDLYAPGSNTRSAWPSSDTGYAELSGTSMATPHVAGVAALILQAHPTDTPADVRTALVSGAAPGRLTGIVPNSGDPNLLLQQPAATDTGDTTPPSVDDVTAQVSGSTVSVVATGTDPDAAPGDGTGTAAAASGVKGFSYVWTHRSAAATGTRLDSLDGRLTVRLGDGTWYVHVRAVDQAGNWSPVRTAGPLVVDVQGPQLLLLRVAPAAPTRYWATVTATDAGTGVSGILLVWNTDPSSVAGPVVWLPGAGSRTSLSPRLPTGTWYVHVRVRDRSGHWSSWRTSGPLRSPLPFVKGLVVAGAPCSADVRGRYGHAAGGIVRCASSATSAALRWR